MSVVGFKSSNSILTGSLTEVSSGVPYLLAGTNVTITTGSNGQITINSTGGGGGGSGDITSVIAGTGLGGGGIAGDVTLTLDTSNNRNVDHASVTITGNNGITGGGDLTTNRTLSLDFSSLTNMTGDISGTTEFILQDVTTESRKAASTIKLSNFNNDSGWTSNTGTVTSVGLTAGNLIDIVGSPITASGNITVDVDLSELMTSTSNDDGDYFVVVDSANDQKKLTKSNINLSGFNNDSGWTNNVGTITGVTAGNGLTGGGSTGSVNLNIGAGTGIIVNTDDISINNTVVATLTGSKFSGPVYLDMGVRTEPGLVVTGSSATGKLIQFYNASNNFNAEISHNGGSQSLILRNNNGDVSKGHIIIDPVNVNSNIVLGNSLVKTRLVFNGNENTSPSTPYIETLGPGGSTDLNIQQSSNANSILVNNEKNNSNFRVLGNSDVGLVLVDGSSNAVVLGSNVTDFSSLPANARGNDVKVLLSGSAGSKDSATRGITLVTGDLVVSGNIYDKYGNTSLNKSQQGYFGITTSSIANNNAFLINTEYAGANNPASQGLTLYNTRVNANRGKVVKVILKNSHPTGTNTWYNNTGGITGSCWISNSTTANYTNHTGSANSIEIIKKDPNTFSSDYSSVIFNFTGSNYPEGSLFNIGINFGNNWNGILGLPSPCFLFYEIITTDFVD